MIEVQTHLAINRIDATTFRVDGGLLTVYKGSVPVATFREWISAIAKAAPGEPVNDAQAQAA